MGVHDGFRKCKFPRVVNNNTRNWYINNNDVNKSKFQSRQTTKKKKTSPTYTGSGLASAYGVLLLSSSSDDDSDESDESSSSS